VKKKKKQIDINHTQEGIGRGCQSAGQVERKQWNGKQVGGRNLVVAITRNQGRVEYAECNFIITICR
jgi:hypothetical protein